MSTWLDRTLLQTTRAWCGAATAARWPTASCTTPTPWGTPSATSWPSASPSPPSPTSASGGTAGTSSSSTRRRRPRQWTRRRWRCGTRRRISKAAVNLLILCTYVYRVSQKMLGLMFPILALTLYIFLNITNGSVGTLSNSHECCCNVPCLGYTQVGCSNGNVYFAIQPWRTITESYTLFWLFKTPCRYRTIVTHDFLIHFN